MALVCAWASPDELPEACAFAARCFGPASVQAAPGRFAWLCGAPPEGPHVAVARDDRTLVAVCCHLPVRLLAGGREIAAAYGVDFMVAPDRRGRGLGERMLALRLERFPASVSTGQSPAMAALYRKAGAATAARFFSALAVRRPQLRGGPKALARDWIAWGLGRARSARAGAAAAGGAAAGPSPGRRELDADAAAVRLGETPGRLLPAEAGPLVDAARLRWRYAGPVYRDYRFWALTTGAGAGGLLVSRLQPAPVPPRAARALAGPAPAVEVIVDLFGAAAELPALLRAAAATSPARRLTALAAGRRLAAAFRAAGFLVRPAAAELVVTSAQAGLQADLAGRDWLVFAGEADADLLRPPAPAANA